MEFLSLYWPWMLLAFAICIASVVLTPRLNRKKIDNVVKAQGFGKSSEKVTLTLGDNTVIETTLGEIKDRVVDERGKEKSIDEPGKSFLRGPYRDWIIEGIFCVIGIAASWVLAYYFPTN
jgi:hypothetical protein